MTMVIGIVTEVAIFYYSEYESISDTDRFQRMITAGNNRMRPIAMTTIAAIFRFNAFGDRYRCRI